MRSLKGGRSRGGEGYGQGNTRGAIGVGEGGEVGADPHPPFTCQSVVPLCPAPHHLASTPAGRGSVNNLRNEIHASSTQPFSRPSSKGPES